MFLAAAAFAASILYHFHDRFWWPPDEGYYAHVADRILAGEILNRDVQDIHPGYVDLANAAALWAFGHELLSLRYPLVAMALVGSCLIFLILLPRGGLLALAGSIAFSSLSLVQFLNPTAHWYGLFIFMLIVAALTWLPPSFRFRPEILGFLVVLLALFRQLSGALVAIGVLAWLLAEDRGSAGSDGRAGRALILVMVAGLGGYLFAKADLVAFVMFGAWPVLALAWVWRATRIDARELLGLGAGMARGGAGAIAPLLVYHLAHGSLGAWFHDTVPAAIGLTDLEFMSAPSYAALPVLGLRGVLALETLTEVVNGVFWLLLPLLPVLLGILALRALQTQAATPHPLPFMALFYGLVSVHYQIPIYLFYTVGVTLAGVLWFAGTWTGRARVLAAVVATMLSIVALHYQAAQSLARGIAGTVEGRRVELSPEPWGSRVGLHVEEGEAALYDHLIATVEAQVAPDEPILALPFNPELYFLTGRRNPFRFANSALALRGEGELAAALATLEREPPRIVFYRPGDKYETAAARVLIAHVRRHYELLESRGGFQIYLFRGDATPGGSGAIGEGDPRR